MADQSVRENIRLQCLNLATECNDPNTGLPNVSGDEALKVAKQFEAWVTEAPKSEKP